MRARQGRALSSPAAFEFPKGAVVGQAAPCEFDGGVLRLPVYGPGLAGAPVASGDDSVVGWVTLSAEQKGGPRFFEEVAPSEIDEVATASALRRCAGPSGGEAAANWTAGSNLSACVELDEALWAHITRHAAGDEVWLVAALTPWCEGCAELLDSWKVLAQRWLGTPRVRFGALDCHAQRGLCAELGLLGHPLVAALYTGSNETLQASVEEWNGRRDAAAREWLPRNWTFGDAAAVSSLLDTLSDGAQPREEQHAAEVPQQEDRCARALGAVQLSAEGEGLNVGTYWPVTVAGGGKLGDALQALADSLDIGAFVGVRQLSAMVTWLEVMERRWPASLGLAEPLAELRSLAATERRRALQAGGGHALCPREWAAAAAGARQAILAAARESQSACRDASCRVWTLLFGLAADEAEPDAAPSEGRGAEPDAAPSERRGVLEAVWSLLASASGSLLSALGGPETAGFLVRAISEGQYGVEGARGGMSVRLALWRLRGGLLAREALACLGRGSDLPDLRWPPSSVCSKCWRKCFRQRRFCWTPWEDQRSAVAATVPSGFADALPNEDAVDEFLRTSFAWASASEGEPSGPPTEAAS